MTSQLHLPLAAVPGTVNPAAGERAKTTGMAQAEAARLRALHRQLDTATPLPRIEIR